MLVQLKPVLLRPGERGLVMFHNKHLPHLTDQELDAVRGELREMARDNDHPCALTARRLLGGVEETVRFNGTWGR